MEIQDFFRLIKRKSQTIIIIMATVLLFTATISLLLPLRYEAKSKLLITQNTTNTDAYALSRSNEYLGNLFSQVVKSSSFLELTLSSNYNIDKAYFEKEVNQKMNIWGKTVQAKTYSDSGIIEINIYHTSPYQAQQIALAVNDVLLNKSQNYHGSGDNIKINIIDQPLVSTYPVKPNITTNLILAAIFSFIFSLFYIYLLPERKYDLKIFKSKKSHQKKLQEENIKAMIWDKLPKETANTNENKAPDSKTQNPHPENTEIKGNIQNILR